MKIIKLATCLIVLSLLATCSRKPDTPFNSAKDFNLKSLTGDEFYKLEDFKGKPLVLNFWASWCAPCKKEMPFFESVWKKHKIGDLALVGINVMDEKKEALKTLKELNISYINLSDSDGDVSGSYNVFALPVTYFISRKGIVSKISYGPFLGRSGDDLFNVNLEKILNEHTAY